jgi:hypothetical protein
VTSKFQEICDRNLYGPDIEGFLRKKENREKSSKFFERVLTQCFCWQRDLKINADGDTDGDKDANRDKDFVALKWLKDDVEIAKGINKILLEVDGKETNVSFNLCIKEFEETINKFTKRKELK